MYNKPPNFKKNATICHLKFKNSTLTLFALQVDNLFWLQGGSYHTRPFRIYVVFNVHWIWSNVNLSRANVMFFLSQYFLLFKSNHVMLFFKTRPRIQYLNPSTKETAQKIRYRQNSTPTFNKEKQTMNIFVVYFRPKTVKSI